MQPLHMRWGAAQRGWAHADRLNAAQILDGEGGVLGRGGVAEVGDVEVLPDLDVWCSLGDGVPQLLRGADHGDVGRRCCLLQLPQPLRLVEALYVWLARSGGCSLQA